MTFVVLAAAVLHALWNALAHGMTDRLLGFALINVSFTAVGAITVWFTPLPSARVWPFLIASALLELVYQVLLMNAYGLGDFAQMYPLARGTAPLLVAIWAGTVLGQTLRATQIVGVVIISAGLIGLAFQGGLPGRAQLPALAAAVGTGVAIASYTIVDGTGVRHAETVLSYIGWAFLLQGPSFIAFAFFSRGRRLFSGVSRETAMRGLTGGLLSLTAYGLVVWAQSRGSLATVAALRETSIVFAAVIGSLVFRERFGYSRMVASAVVVSGIAILELT